MAGLSKQSVERLLRELNEELRREEVSGELYLVGGAVMCLAFEARPSTKDLDGFFRPKAAISKAAQRVASRNELTEGWLNDAAKGFLSDKGDFRNFLELSNLQVFIPSPEYLFAMKCLAMRLGAEFADEDDVKFLIRVLNLRTYDEAIEILSRYYSVERYPQKSFYALEEMLAVDR